MGKGAALCWIALCCACGSERGTRVVASAGTTFVEALFVPTSWPESLVDDGGAGLEIVLADRPGGCEEIAARRALAGSARAQVSILHGGRVSLATGAYRAGPSQPDPKGFAEAWYYSTDDRCRVVDRPRFSSSGAIWLDEIGDDVVSGRMEVTLDDGTTLTGTFSARRCPAVALLPDDQAACVDR